MLCETNWQQTTTITLRPFPPLKPGLAGSFPQQFPPLLTLLRVLPFQTTLSHVTLYYYSPTLVEIVIWHCKMIYYFVVRCYTVLQDFTLCCKMLSYIVHIMLYWIQTFKTLFSWSHLSKHEYICIYICSYMYATLPLIANKKGVFGNTFWLTITKIGQKRMWK